jgi:hypothetical protein
MPVPGGLGGWTVTNIAPKLVEAELKRRFNSAPLISALLRPYPGFASTGHKSSHKSESQSLNARVS